MASRTAVVPRERPPPTGDPRAASSTSTTLSPREPGFGTRQVACGIVPVIPAAALAQAWRDRRQARLAQVVNACFVAPLDETLAKSAGELCGKANVADLVDAAVVASAACRGDAVLTGDPRDLRRLASHAPNVVIIKL
jgi:hypothetical protein